jgi:hypothetical protein
VIRFKSIISRIVILHVIAVAITSILMSLALSWLLNLATNNIHKAAMEEEAASVAHHLISGRWQHSLELPPDFQGFYSQPYGRYSYAVVDDHGCAYRKSNPNILVVQSAEDGAAENVPGAIDGARDRRILFQG